MLPGLLRRRNVLAGVVLAVMVGLLANAAVTGALSGPHARYQSRVMWLPVLTMFLAAAADREQRAPWVAFAARAALIPHAGRVT